jgi:membrane fusion protein, heavy metal efflux system
MKIRLTAAFIALALAGCGNSGTTGGAGHDHAIEGANDEAETRGEHGGRLLKQDDITVELAIAEEGTPPKYEAWFYRDSKPLPAKSGEIDIALTRLGGVRETHALRARNDGRLMADSIVGEPHSFDVAVTARIDGRTLRWTFPSYEGRTVIAAGIARESGIRVAKAGPGVIADEHEVQGLLTPVEGRVASAMARFPGPIRTLRANVGDPVRAGQPLASIESNMSLTTYTIAAPISGVVLSRNAALGAVASEGAPLFEIADLSTLWVDLHVFGADATHLAPGAAVTVTRMSDGVQAQTTLERVLPGTATASQSTVARATLDNADGRWRPGSAVSAKVTVARRPVAMAVPLSALQTFRDWEVVFVRVGDTYEVRPLEPGRRDATQVEVLSGLREGDDVVVEQSYLVKADIEKSGASHDH